MVGASGSPFGGAIELSRVGAMVSSLVGAKALSRVGATALPPAGAVLHLLGNVDV